MSDKDPLPRDDETWKLINGMNRWDQWLCFRSLDNLYQRMGWGPLEAHYKSADQEKLAKERRFMEKHERWMHDTMRSRFAKGGDLE
jgi:hypothetical protein